ncbi:MULTISPECIES: DUF6314 family protein [Streptomyces]|uniref:DUF6314 domain-containing protein n=1 Tax=Streptomyces venezuelae TaxID=54571 RepID=A0A5P2B8D2_STRVZ|nr:MULTISPECIES: DUF6314 family protein [Streptomyces]NDZ99490.1 hypothetical protein [Streptomyces sp. SID10116]MYY82323.1 hypothetical protein [Streptomyces sp. SID335]NDZ89730.1 hypothetical protein [Streptomyces sp. SID10115]NEB43290.1 hypothetical protein [Streptomyces sp. SID339]QES26150.1 hypothetical protein DEJ47_06440 [Streptomyces venezuelae]
MTVPVPAPVPSDLTFHAVPDVLAHLAGGWHVERTVRDLADGSEGRFTGTTYFSPLPAPVTDTTGLLHHESGTFTWQGVARPAERTLRFLPGDGGAGTARVEFADGRFFHDLDLRTGSWTTDHPCADDLYRGEFEVIGADRWRSRWRVGGPAKDLLLVTEYRRAPSSPRAPEEV